MHRLRASPRKVVASTNHGPSFSERGHIWLESGLALPNQEEGNQPLWPHAFGGTNTTAPAAMIIRHRKGNARVGPDPVRRRWGPMAETVADSMMPGTVAGPLPPSKVGFPLENGQKPSRKAFARPKPQTRVWGARKVPSYDVTRGPNADNGGSDARFTATNPNQWPQPNLDNRPTGGIPEPTGGE